MKDKPADNTARRDAWRDVAQSAMLVEAQAICAAAAGLDLDLLRYTAGLILNRLPEGKVVTSGVGKSGLVARRLADCLCATGVPAVYLHPVDAMHGGVGLIGDQDLVVVVSKSGATPELRHLINIIMGRAEHIPMVGIIGTPGSTIAGAMDAVLDSSVDREADPWNMIPTASTAAATAIADALVCVLAYERGLTAADLSRTHPGGAR